jgi:HEAT repeat protein
VAALKHENEWVRAKSAFSIGEMRERAEAAVPALVQALRDKSPRVRSKSAKALNKIRLSLEERSANSP